MMETSIDEGLETEGEAEEDPSQAFEAFQATRSGQRRHTLSEVTNQVVVMPRAGMTLEKHQVRPYSIVSYFGHQELVALLIPNPLLLWRSMPRTVWIRSISVTTLDKNEMSLG